MTVSPTARLAARSVQFDNMYVGSMPCMPCRREIHTGRHNFLHRSWGPLEPFDDSMPELLHKAGVHSHKVSRRRDCHSAAPPSPCSWRFNSDGEGMSAE